MARWIAFSISCMREVLIVPAKGPRMRKDLSRVVTCSHFAMEVSLSPPSPAGSSTCVGANRRVVDRGTTMTSFANRFRTSNETTRAGRSFVSEGCPGSLTKYISPRRGYDMIYLPHKRLAERAAILDHG